jgi:hypothetical protein
VSADPHFAVYFNGMVETKLQHDGGANAQTTAASCRANFERLTDEQWRERVATRMTRRHHGTMTDAPPA